jgi:hypothetical protein
MKEQRAPNERNQRRWLWTPRTSWAKDPQETQRHRATEEGNSDAFRNNIPLRITLRKVMTREDQKFSENRKVSDGAGLEHSSLAHTIQPSPITL